MGTAIRNFRVAVYCSPWSICSQLVSRLASPWSPVTYGVPFRWWNMMYIPYDVSVRVGRDEGENRELLTVNGEGRVW